MRDRMKLKEVFTNPLTSGIFSSLQALNVPWKNEYISQQLDLTFISSYGQRQPSPLVKVCLDETGKLTTAKQNLLATTLFALYGKNWEKEYATMLFEYDPIENYSMIETHGGTDTRLETPTNWKETRTEKPGVNGYSETETQTPTNWKETRSETVGQDGYSETETQTPTNWTKTTEQDRLYNDTDTSSSLYTFNSGSAVPVSESDVTTDSKIEETQSGTFETKREIEGEKLIDIERTGTYETKREIEGEKITDTEQLGTFETKREIEGEKITETGRTGTYEDKTTYNSTLTRSGNIGVTTSQQMIESERNLWLWNFFQDVVFRDLAKSLTLSLY